MTVALYIRVSTLEQATEGYSIAAQKERLIAYCMAQGWTNYKVYVDEGVSAKDTDRPLLNQLLDHIKKGQISMILVYRLDRLTRSVSDLYNLLKMLDQHNCAFKSATEIYDTSTAMGRMFIGLVALLAQWETENLSERIKMALEKKVADGERVGNVPFGFELAKDEKLILNDRAPIILDMINKVKSGMSASQVANYLTKTNNDRAIWHPQAVIRVLKNPALYGATRWNDKVFEGTHEGLISKTEFIKLQQILEDRSTHRRREVESTYIFQGVLKCPTCNKSLSVNRYIRKRKDGSEYQGSLYKCQNCYKEGRPMISIGENRLLEALYSYMENVNIENIKPPKDEKDERIYYDDQLRQIEKKREKYQRAWASDLISDDEFKKLMNETRDVYEDLRMKLNDIQEPLPINVDAIKNIVISFNEGFYYLTHEEKRMFVSQFVKKIEFELLPQPPLRPDKAKNGKPLVVITHVNFY